MSGRTDLSNTPSRRLVQLLRLAVAADESAPPVAGGQAHAPQEPGPADLPPTLTAAESGGPARRPPGDPNIRGYRVIRLLSEGGMGTVWLAEQEGTHQPVALKLLKGGALHSQQARDMFQREVELTARLQHPHIARVYGTGVHQHDYYYAMEYIEGVHMDRYVADQRLAPRRILELMARVCAAVQHAHQRGIVHRDLKFSNILVTPDGAPHVVDFGLALLVEPDGTTPPSASDSASARAGTLLFMSPEQAAGQDGQLDTRTDVYSLGVILFRLLTGRYPHDPRGAAAEIRQRIADGRITRPRQASRAISAELETLLLKALALSPDQRYMSAGALGEDLGNYLRCDPLRARTPTTAYLLGRLVRKYRWAFSLAALALAAAAGGTVLYVYAVRAEQRQTDRARIEAMRQRQLAELNAVQAAEQRRIALDTVNQLVFQVQRRLHEGMGQLELRRQLLDTAAEGLRKIGASVEVSGPALHRSQAAALLQVGDVFAQAGRPEEARAAYARALTAFQTLADAGAQGLQPARDVVVATTRLGQACLNMRDIAAAGQHLQAAAALVEQLLERAPQDAELLRDRWAVAVALGDLNLETRAPVEAQRRFAVALTVAEELAGRNPAGSTEAHDLSISCNRLGNAWLALSDTGRALECFARALGIGRAEAGRRPHSAQAQRDVSVSLAKVGEANFALGRLDDARRHYLDAAAIGEDLARADPERFETDVDLAAVLFMLGEVEGRSAKPTEAAAYYERALRMLRQLAQSGKLESQPKCRDLLAQVEERLRSHAGPASRPAP